MRVLELNLIHKRICCSTCWIIIDCSLVVAHEADNTRVPVVERVRNTPERRVVARLKCLCI